MFSLPFSPRRVVLGASEHEEMGELIRARRPDLQVRASALNDVTDADLSWGECYVGFRRPPNVTAMGSIRWVQSTGAGVDPWLTPTASGVVLDNSIVLTRSSESFGPMIAEWVVARVFAFQQQLTELAESQRARRWAPRAIARVAGTRALVIGTGDVGRGVAAALSGLGVAVRGVSRSGSDAGPAFLSVHRVGELESLVGDAQWIIITLPRTDATEGLVSRDLLSRCQGAVLLNAGRGAVVAEGVLPEALERGWIRGAALDVFETEPLPQTSPLWADSRVMISPHISGLTTAEGAVEAFLECLTAFESGELPRWVVDRDRGY